MSRMSSHRALRMMTGTMAVMSVSLLGIGAATPTFAADQPVIAADQKTDRVMNYAVNLNRDASRAQLDEAVNRANGLGKVLAQYPEINTFFVQASAKDFAAKYAKELTAAGIGLHSVGPTRTKEVSGKEVVVPKPNGATGDRAASYAAESESQFVAERNFQSDPDTPKAWGIAATGADEAAKVDVKLAPVTVGVIDSGIEGGHKDLKDQIDASKSVGCSTNGVADTSYEAWQPDDTPGSDHGTHVAGTIGAATNGVGVEGVAPKARLAAVKVVNRDGSIYPEYASCGFMWAGHQGFDVTNNSYYVDPWEYWVPSEGNQAAGLEAVTRAVKFSQTQGVLNIAAAGNSNADLDNVKVDNGSPNDNGDENIIENRDVEGGLDIPAMLPGVVTVSAVGLEPEPGKRKADLSKVDPKTAKLRRAYFSNYGATNVDVAAPGVDIYSTVSKAASGGKEYDTFSGTSMASPHTAGVAALLRAVNPTLTADEAAGLLKKHAKKAYNRLETPAEELARVSARNRGAVTLSEVGQTPAEKEYRGNGFISALSAVLDDQPAPTINEVEYSTDGTHWAPLAGVKIDKDFKIRVHVTGPATEINASVSGTKFAFSKSADGAFDGDYWVESDQYQAKDFAKDASLKITANGRNNDERANDDASGEVTFSVEVPSPKAEPTKPATPAEPAVPGKGGKEDTAKEGASRKDKEGASRKDKVENRTQVVHKTRQSLSATGVAGDALGILSVGLLALGSTLALRRTSKK